MKSCLHLKSHVFINLTKAREVGGNMKIQSLKKQRIHQN